MIGHIAFHPGQGLPALLHGVLALLLSSWRALAGSRADDNGIDWEDGETS